MSAKLFVRPVSWSLMREAVSCIQMFGYMDNGESIYIRIPQKSTFILRFQGSTENDAMEELKAVFCTSEIRRSRVDPCILCVRTPMLDCSSIVKWMDMKQDPCGILASFWAWRQILPYDWIQVERYSMLDGKYTTCSFNIIVDENNIARALRERPSTIPPRMDYVPPLKLLFWDGEMYTPRKGTMPDALRPEDEIRMISITTVWGDCVQHHVIVMQKTGHVGQRRTIKSTINVIEVSTEKHLLETFLTLFRQFGPDRVVFYNGAVFDMPYFIKRCRYCGVEIYNLSKILGGNTAVGSVTVGTSFGVEVVEALRVPGVEWVDLLGYSRKVYPWLCNFKLDTVAKWCLGEGKEDMPVEELMEALEYNDPAKMAKAVTYCHVDSLRLTQLWSREGIQGVLEQVGNTCGVTGEMVGMVYFNRLVEGLLYQVDPGLIFMNQGNNNQLTKQATVGVYKDIWVYDCGELYRQVMVTHSTNLLVKEVGKRIEGCPGLLIQEVFNSRFICQYNLVEAVEKELKKYNILSVDGCIVRSKKEIHEGWARLVSRVPLWVVVGKASYLMLTEKREMIAAGLAHVCRPCCLAATNVIEHYMRYLAGLGSFEMLILHTMSRDQFYIKEKINALSMLGPNTIKYKLALQYNVSSCTSVQYMMTQRGPILTQYLTQEDKVDYAFYQSKINKYIACLKKLNIYD